MVKSNAHIRAMIADRYTRVKHKGAAVGPHKRSIRIRRRREGVWNYPLLTSQHCLFGLGRERGREHPRRLHPRRFHPHRFKAKASEALSVR
jgi:hypothetical protein